MFNKYIAEEKQTLLLLYSVGGQVQIGKGWISGTHYSKHIIHTEL